MAIKKAKEFLEDGQVLDLENLPDQFPFKNIKFDYVVLADVLEHIKNPKEVLEKIKEQLDFRYLIISLPNIAFFHTRLKLLLGNFNYENHGIMDESHLHFYTFKTACNLINESGLNILDVIPYPLTNRKLEGITHPLTKMLPNLLARQFVFVVAKDN